MGGNFIAFYLILLGLIATLGFLGGDLANVEDLGVLPTIEEGGFLDTVSYIWDYVTYLFGFKGLQIFGIPIAISRLIATVLNGLLVYVILRLIRGGG